LSDVFFRDLDIPAMAAFDQFLLRIRLYDISSPTYVMT